MDYIVVKESDGAIVGSINSNVIYAPSADGVTAETHYWNLEVSEFQTRVELPLVVDGSTVSGIPTTGELSVTGPLSYEGHFAGPEMSFRFDIPGTYTLEFRPEAVRWLTTTINITVSDDE